jgi:hypothetical protein
MAGYAQPGPVECEKLFLAAGLASRFNRWHETLP